MLPIKNWSKPLRVDQIATDRTRPPSGTGLVYIVTGQDQEHNVKYLGSAHATDDTDGRARVGTLIGALTDFGLWHSGGLKLCDEFKWDQINRLYIMWAVIIGCPVLAERELRNHYLVHSQLSPEYARLDGGDPARNLVCNRVCIPQNLDWSEPSASPSQSDSKPPGEEAREPSDEAKYNVEPGDILMVQGRGLVSKLVLAAQGASAQVSHVAMVLSKTPPIIIEAISPRVRVRPLRLAIKDAEHSWIAHPPLTDEQRTAAVENFCRMSGAPYGYQWLVPHLLNAVFRTRWFTSHMIPSWAIGIRKTRRPTPDKDAVANQPPVPSEVPWWFRVMGFTVAPLALPFWFVGLSRDFFRGLLGPTLLMLAEGLCIFLLGFHFAHGQFHFATKWLAWPVAYCWLMWVLNLELLAQH